MGQSAANLIAKKAEMAEAREERAAREASKASMKEGMERQAAREALLERERALEKAKEKKDAPAYTASTLASLAGLLAKNGGLADLDLGLKGESPLLFDI